MSNETIEYMDATMKQLRSSKHADAGYYVGALDMLISMWLDGEPTAAEYATEWYWRIREEFLDEWMKENTSKEEV